ncbi:hypothetical protein [uncultured Microbacterium sp.]|uniref:hypothetical protein n=1 Tax=uncultured Microbacterium sp. TaxID=191216 RepID=UPI0028D2ABED|nr:hypothetical protein [uncultured Microbacterium sp.]
MTPRFAAAAIVGVLVGTLFTSTQAQAASLEPDYVRTSYDGTIYEVTDDDVVPLSFEKWSELGFPTFTAAPTVFQKVLTFPTVTATTEFARAEATISDAITWQEYQAAGFPAVGTLAWGPSISVYKWGTSQQLFAQDDAGDIIALTFSQWSGAGFPAFAAREGRGFVRLSWDTTGGIAYLCDTSTGHGGRLTYEQWTRLGSPTPYTVTRTANDTVWRIFGGVQLSYVGAMNLVYDPNAGLEPGFSNRAIAFDEWRAMGSPAPENQIPAASSDLRCQPGASTPWE